MYDTLLGVLRPGPSCLPHKDHHRIKTSTTQTYPQDFKVGAHNSTHVQSGRMRLEVILTSTQLITIVA